jgi:hypothetical protein
VTTPTPTSTRPTTPPSLHHTTPTPHRTPSQHTTLHHRLLHQALILCIHRKLLSSLRFPHSNNGRPRAALRPVHSHRWRRSQRRGSGPEWKPSHCGPPSGTFLTIPPCRDPQSCIGAGGSNAHPRHDRELELDLRRAGMTTPSQSTRTYSTHSL